MQQMTWTTLVRLPERVGAIVDAHAAELGVERAVAARIILMQWAKDEGQQPQGERTTEGEE